MVSRRSGFFYRSNSHPNSGIGGSFDIRDLDVLESLSQVHPLFDLGISTLFNIWRFAVNSMKPLGELRAKNIAVFKKK